MVVRMRNLLSIIIVLISVEVLISNAFDVKTELVFRLYTRKSSKEYELKPDSTSIAATPFDPRHPTRIFVHGYKSKEKVIHRYRDAYLELGNYNFIAVDWTIGAQTFNYFSAKSRTVPISDKLAELIDALVAYGMKLEDLTIIGHSLGAHTAGRAARQLKSNGKVAVIIGLDPASIGFRSHVENRLTRTDAEYVQVIHTDGNKFGLMHAIGHADFYPNGGRQQPGCVTKRSRLSNFIDKCNHVRSHHLFLESLTTTIIAIQCASLEEIQEMKCSFKNGAGQMGGDITANSTKPYGVFYLETKSESPYNIADYLDYDNIELI